MSISMEDTPMVSSKDILSQTGLKNIKTLTRWYKAGIIPEPLIRTHPSGRGKMAYWPDWVLDRCIRLVELQKQGHSLRSAIMQLDIERVVDITKDIEEQPSISDVLESKSFTLKNGQTTNLLNIFFAVITQNIKKLISDPDAINALLSKMKEMKIIDLAMSFLKAGYNPVLVFDGSDIDITTDFMVSHHLSYKPQKGKVIVVVQLLGPVQKAFSIIGRQFPDIPDGSLALPAPKIWAKNKELLIEYDIYLGGGLGFELIRETAKVVGKLDEHSDDFDKNYR